ncbi:MAG: hypothetical protein ACLUTJ_14965 [Phocaeicola massiliensis]
MDKTAETLIDVSGFISEYSAHMMGCGVHTSRVIRSANRIGESFGYMVKISVIQKKKRRDRTERPSGNSFFPEYQPTFTKAIDCR